MHPHTAFRTSRPTRMPAPWHDFQGGEIYGQGFAPGGLVNCDGGAPLPCYIVLLDPSVALQPPGPGYEYKDISSPPPPPPPTPLPIPALHGFPFVTCDASSSSFSAKLGGTMTSPNPHTYCFTLQYTLPEDYETLCAQVLREGGGGCLGCTHMPDTLACLLRVGIA